jgi:hypothetical protein
MPAYGTKRTSRPRRRMSAFEGKADAVEQAANSSTAKAAGSGVSPAARLSIVSSFEQPRREEQAQSLAGAKHADGKREANGGVTTLSNCCARPVYMVGPLRWRQIVSSLL